MGMYTTEDKRLIKSASSGQRQTDSMSGHESMTWSWSTVVWTAL